MFYIFGFTHANGCSILGSASYSFDLVNCWCIGYRKHCL